MESLRSRVEWTTYARSRLLGASHARPRLRFHSAPPQTLSPPLEQPSPSAHSMDSKTSWQWMSRSFLSVKWNMTIWVERLGNVGTSFLSGELGGFGHAVTHRE